MNQQIGYRIRKIRESQDLSQAEVADELGFTAGAYAKIERGETDPSITRLYEIAKVLDVTIYDLLEDDPASKKNKTETMIENQVIRLMYEMDILKKELQKLLNKKK